MKIPMCSICGREFIPAGPGYQPEGQPNHYQTFYDCPNGHEHVIYRAGDDRWITPDQSELRAWVLELERQTKR